MGQLAFSFYLIRRLLWVRLGQKPLQRTFGDEIVKVGFLYKSDALRVS